MAAHRIDLSGGTKRCPVCIEDKSVDEFHARSGRASGLVSLCKTCASAKGKARSKAQRAEYARSYRQRMLAEDPDYDRRANLRWLYGMTLEEYDAMLEAQGGACAVCGGPPMGKGRYHVDHCHSTGRVRGLLCHKCNVTLGMVQDSCEHLLALVDYLEIS